MRQQRFVAAQTGLAIPWIEGEFDDSTASLGSNVHAECWETVGT